MYSFIHLTASSEVVGEGMGVGDVLYILISF